MQTYPLGDKLEDHGEGMTGAADREEHEADLHQQQASHTNTCHIKLWSRSVQDTGGLSCSLESWLSPTDFAKLPRGGLKLSKFCYKSEIWE